MSGVVFFSSPIEARKAGFRPCKRCKPDKPLLPQVELISRICEFIGQNQDEDLNLECLARIAGQSQYHFQRTFKKVTGISPKEYIEASRLGKIKKMLREGASIRGSTYAAGYKTTGWLYFDPNKKLGMSPGIYKKGGFGVEINYAIVDTSLGKLLVAATSKGICAVNLANSDQELLKDLRSEYPNAVISTAKLNSKFDFWVKEIVDYLDAARDLGELPLDISMTAFQWKVLKALQAIPLGEVRSYSQVAKYIGKPKATRAVANVCASNPVPLVIPCHRVIRNNGDIGGYGMGVRRKRILLHNEGVDLSNLAK